MKSQWFPNFPIKRARPTYVADEKSNTDNKKALNDGCVKLFPKHKQMTCGTWLVTCCYPAKRIYGFLKMVVGESPKFLTDFVMARLPLDYNPIFIYDAACKVKYNITRNLGRSAPLFLAPAVGWEPFGLPAGGPSGPQQYSISLF